MDRKFLALIAQMVSAFSMNAKFGGWSSPQVKTLSVLKTLTLPQEHQFVSRTWMLLLKQSLKYQIYKQSYPCLVGDGASSGCCIQTSSNAIRDLIGFHYASPNLCLFLADLRIDFGLINQDGFTSWVSDQFWQQWNIQSWSGRTAPGG